MKFKRIFPLTLITFITSCTNSIFVLENKVFSFDSVIDIKLFEGKEENVTYLTDLIKRFDALSDNYLSRNINNVNSINQTNEDIEIGKELYDLLKAAFEVKNEGANYYNPLCGSLSKKWKESLNNGQILDENNINQELSKIQNSSLVFKDNNVVQRLGDAEIDLGGIVKGYVLDLAQDYLNKQNITSYLIDGGMSSILLGEKKNNDGFFNVGLSDVDRGYLKLKNCFVSTSGVSRQGKTINGVTYSHIVNPETGSAINVNDAVIVISDKGYYGDAMSTSLMMNTVEEIKVIEKEHSFQTIVVKNKQIVYKSEGLEVFYN